MSLRKLVKYATLALIPSVALGSLTSCIDTPLEEAQTNLNNLIVVKLKNNEDMNKQYAEAAQDLGFEFLEVDVDKKQEQYKVDINGLLTLNAANKEKAENAYTTLSYLVEGHYFENVDPESQVEVINALSSIVENEEFKAVAIQKVGNPKDISDAIKSITESPLKDYNVNSNFLYAVGNLEFDEANNVATFSTKNASRFSTTVIETTTGIISVNPDGSTEIGPIVTSDTKYETYFMDYDISIKLTPEEMKAAQEDNKVVFDKFVEYVKTKDFSRYMVKKTRSQDEKEFTADLMNEVSLEREK